VINPAKCSTCTERNNGGEFFKKAGLARDITLLIELGEIVPSFE